MSSIALTDIPKGPAELGLRAKLFSLKRMRIYCEARNISCSFREIIEVWLEDWLYHVYAVSADRLSATRHNKKKVQFDPSPFLRYNFVDISLS